MSCPDIYIGPSFTQAPPTPFWQNTAIDVSGGTGLGTNFTAGVDRLIAVTVRNHGTDDSPQSQLELYWSDPTTGFAALPGNLIGTAAIIPTIPGATTPPPLDGEESRNFLFTPTSVQVGTNGGHVCLLARVENITELAGCPQQFFGLNPATDPRSAIRNIHVFAPPPPPPPMPGESGGRGNKNEMFFAFAATNTLPGVENTKLVARPLSPQKDSDALQLLASDRAVDALLSRRQLKFSLPKNVLLGTGREQAVIPLQALARKSKGRGEKIPRLSRLGPLTAAHAKHLARPGVKLVEANRPISLKLAPGEMQHSILQIRPRDSAQAAYAVAIEHHAGDGRLIGGLTVIFVPPHRAF